MKLSGMLSKIMDNYLCLRGVAGIKKLAEISEINPDIQRDLLEEHKDEMKEFLERGEYAFFPEVILSMHAGLSDAPDDGVFEALVAAVDSIDEGFKKSEIGRIKINFKSDDNKLIDDRKQLKVATLEFDEAVVRLSRIDGNHRLSAAEYLSNDILIPFCIIIFSNEEEAKNSSRAIFHNINSKQIPLKLEQNLKIIIESDDVYPDILLENPQPFGAHYKHTRKLLCGNGCVDFDCFPLIKNFIYGNKYSFFTDLFRHLLKEGLIEENTAVDDVKKELVSVENALSDAGIISSSQNSAIVGALAYYKLSNMDKYFHFIKWIAKNHIADAEAVGIDNIISIFDKVYDSAPQRVFLARWYPSEEHDGADEAKRAECRVDAVKELAEELNLDLTDLGTRKTGAFDIREVMYHDIRECDVFIADLSGARHNVMIEVGYALKHIDTGRMLFYFQASDKCKNVPFDVSHLNYVPIVDSGEIKNEIGHRLRVMLEQAKNGEI